MQLAFHPLHPPLLEEREVQLRVTVASVMRTMGQYSIFDYIQSNSCFTLVVFTRQVARFNIFLSIAMLVQDCSRRPSLSLIKSTSGLLPS